MNSCCFASKRLLESLGTFDLCGGYDVRFRREGLLCSEAVQFTKPPQGGAVMDLNLLSADRQHPLIA